MGETVRITCDAVGRQKLFIEVTKDGLTAWCKICHIAHFVPKEQLRYAWDNTEAIFCEKQREVLVHS